MSEFVYLHSVSTLTYDVEKCNACGSCVTVCPHRILKLYKKRIDIVDLDRCMECGACMMNCRSEAIKVKAGVGCAAAVITGFFNKSEPTCGCSTTCG